LWTETDLEGLIGQSESIRREFKSGRLLEGNQDSKWVEELSKQVSAFANTEGGELFIGIDEDKKSKPRVATRLDGVPSGIAPETLQQLIEGNVSPYLPGIRVSRVPLAAQRDRVVFIIQVPDGSTAYQAKDGRYYGRSEFEVKHLPDHEVRLRMSRGKVARGTVFAKLAVVDLGVERERRARERLESNRAADRSEEIEIDRMANGKPIFFNPKYDFDLMSAKFLRDVIRYEFCLRNDGEITIRAPLVRFQEINKENNGVRVLERIPPRISFNDTIIYPGDEIIIAGAQLAFECERDFVIQEGDYKIRWNVFMDNSPPSTGNIDIDIVTQEARMR
jgi:hypothetical protein